jgi:hypothetical protein
MSVDHKPLRPDSPEAKDFYPSPNQKVQWRLLWYQLLFLDWLQRKGAQAGYLSTFAALVLVWAVSAVHHFRQQPKAQKT